MYQKLALRNIRRSLQNYIIYFITLTFIVGLLYSFLSLGFSEDILALSDNMPSFATALLGLSVVVCFISSFVVDYAIQFILNQRKKEFATYQLLGMEASSIQSLFLIENGVLAIFSFFFGIFLGVGISGLLVQIVNNIFEIPQQFQISFSLQALFSTLFLFIVMYLFGMFRCAKTIRSYKIIDLLYHTRKNEPVKPLSKKQFCFSILISIFLIVVGFGISYLAISSQNNAGILFICSGILLILLGVYLSYQHLPLFCLLSMKKSPKRRYKNYALFYWGQLGRKIQSSGRFMGIIAVLFTISLTTMFMGLTMGSAYKINLKSFYPYDVAVAVDAPFTKDSMQSIVDFTQQQTPIQQSLAFHLYTTEEYPIDILSISDYNQLRQMLNLQPIPLSSQEFLIHCDTWKYVAQIQSTLQQQPQISIADHSLSAAENPIHQEPMEQYRIAGNNGYVLILPDSIVKQLSAPKVRLVMQLQEQASAELKQDLNRFLRSGQWQPTLQANESQTDRIPLYLSVKAWGIANSLTTYTILAFCGLYLSIVFILLCCTILAFKHLSDLQNSRLNYSILHKIGVEKDTQRHIISKESLLFFVFPAILPVSLLFLLILATTYQFQEYILQKNIIPLYGSITLLVFILVYGTYYFATKWLFDRSILTE